MSDSKQNQKRTEAASAVEPPVMPLPHVTIKVVIDPGTDIERACTETIELANRIGCDVEFNFNGCICVAKPGDSFLNLKKAYHQEQESGRPHKFAFAHQAA